MRVKIIYSLTRLVAAGMGVGSRLIEGCRNKTQRCTASP